MRMQPTTTTYRTRRGRSAAEARLVLLLSLIGLCSTIGLTALCGQSTAAGSTDPNFFFPTSALQEAHESPQSSLPPLTHPGIAEELPHANLGREEASELMLGVFGPEVKESSGVFDQLEDVELVAPNVAIVPAEAGSNAEAGDREASFPGSSLAEGEAGTAREDLQPASLIESNVPLGVEATKGELDALELGLESTDEGLSPETPLVPVTIPVELGEGIELPEDKITVNLLGAAATRAPSDLRGESAFYPNIEPETDLIVSPTPTGFQTFTQLRTPTAPRVEEYKLSVPADDSVIEPPTGGAEILEGSEAIAMVRPPTAVDAAGKTIPTSTAVEGDVLTVTVKPSSDATFPILVDPIIDDYPFHSLGEKEPHNWQEQAWTGQMPAGAAGWLAATDSPSNYSMNLWQQEGSAPPSRWGLHISALLSPTSAGTQGNWNYYVPRFFTDQAQSPPEIPTSFIHNVWLEGLEYHLSFQDHDVPWQERPQSPYFMGGIWNTIQGGWVAPYSRMGQEGDLSPPFTYYFENRNENGNAKNFGFALASGENVSSSWFGGSDDERTVLDERATIELSDKDAPTVGSTHYATRWVNEAPTAEIPFSSGDPGLGIKDVWLEQPNINGAPENVETGYPCLGTAGSPCPRWWKSGETGKPKLQYYPQVIPQGENWVRLVSQDAVGHKSTEREPLPTEVDIRVDHTKPNVKLSGLATEQATYGSNGGEYEFSYEGTDGGVVPLSVAEAPPDAVGVMHVPSMARPRNVSEAPHGNLWVIGEESSVITEMTRGGAVVETLNLPASEGYPTAVATSSSGHAVVSSNGSGGCAVAEVWNENGKQHENIITAKSGTETTLGVYGATSVAVDGSGDIWVADSGNHRVLEFSKERKLIRAINTYGASKGAMTTPTYLSVGPKESVWILDYNDDHILEFSASGEFILEFGGHGSLLGQIMSPTGLYVDRKGDVWVSDGGTGRVEAFSAGGEPLVQFGSVGGGNRQFSALGGLTIDLEGYAWIADAGHGQLQKWRLPGYLPAFAEAFGESTSGTGALSNPSDVAVDSNGAFWVADTGHNRLAHYNEAGQYIGSAGAAGTGNGELTAPAAVADSGSHIWTVEPEHVVEYYANPTGGYLTMFGSPGTAVGRLNEPSGIALTQAGNVLVGEAERVQEFSEAGKLLRVVRTVVGAGRLKVAVAGDGSIWTLSPKTGQLEHLSSEGALLGQFPSAQVGGEVTHPSGLTVDSSGNVWTTDEATGRIIEYSERGVPIIDLPDKGGAAAGPRGIVVERTGRILVADSGANRLSAWTRPTENQSGVVKGSILLDGSPVLNNSQSCDADCPMNHTWILHANSVSAGTHTLTARVEDGVGLVGEKSVTVLVQNDHTPPVITPGGLLFKRPAGWVEQKRYGFTMKATDSGFGVTSLEAKLDGKVVYSQTRRCIMGGCQMASEASVSFGAVPGGEHRLELIATDGGGNQTAQAFNIRVDPQGTVSVGEAMATLEATEKTATTNTVGPPVSETGIEGTAPGLGFVPISQGLESTGGSTPTVVSKSPSEGVTINVINPALVYLGCAGNSPTDVSGLTGYEEEHLVGGSGKDCLTRTNLPDGGLLPMVVKPTETSSAAGAVVPTGENAAAVATNLKRETDMVTRPLYDGALTYGIIRSVESPEQFSWTVELLAGETLTQLDAQHAEVFMEGHPVLGISAEPAHDAVGTVVPSSLSVSGDVVTLTIKHRPSTELPASYVYPIMAGAGWQGGFQVFPVDGPPPEEHPAEGGEPGEEFEEEEWRDTDGHPHTEGVMVSAPLANSGSGSNLGTTRGFNFYDCPWHQVSGLSTSNIPAVGSSANGRPIGCHGPLPTAEGGGTIDIDWANSISGEYKYYEGFGSQHVGAWVKLLGVPHCKQWWPPGIETPPADRPHEVGECHADEREATSHLDLEDWLRFSPSPGATTFVPGLATCYEMDSILPSVPISFSRLLGGVYHGLSHVYWEPVPENDKCQWGHFPDPRQYNPLG